MNAAISTMPTKKADRVHLARQGGPKQAARDTFRISERRRKVAEMYREWKPQAEIAEALGVSQRTISEDLAVILDEYRTRYAHAIEERTLENTFIELQRINKIELEHARVYNEAMDAWQRSKGILKSTRRVVRAAKEGGSEMVPMMGQVDEQESFGDPRFLMAATKNLEAMRGLVTERCKILGLYVERDTNAPKPDPEREAIMALSDEALAQKFMAASKGLLKA
jgi:hypothetical protein